MNIAIVLVYNGGSVTREGLEAMAHAEAQRKARKEGRQITKLLSAEPTGRPKGCEDLNARKFIFETKEGQ